MLAARRSRRSRARNDASCRVGASIPKRRKPHLAMVNALLTERAIPPASTAFEFALVAPTFSAHCDGRDRDVFRVLEADYTWRRESLIVTVMRSCIVENKKAAQ